MLADNSNYGDGGIDSRALCSIEDQIIRASALLESELPVLQGDFSGLTYQEVGLLHSRTGGELARRNAEARAAAGEDGGGW
jgi:hypothetical protein